MSYLAFFDLDRTILKVNSGKILFWRAFRAGLISRRKYYSAFILSVLNKLNLIDSARIINVFPAWLTGIPIEEFKAICELVVEEHLISDIRPEIRDEIDRHKRNGAKLVMLSATVDLICNPVAEHLQLDDVLCTRLDVSDGIINGETIGKICFREEKFVQLVEYIDGDTVKLDDIYYYGDSLDDLPVLKKVGYPVVVSPGKKLKKIAEENQWEYYEW
jgi:putative phosphoserine phosphatase/1-acylglycerol-3-phosphate O-acyltransferase